jgi:chaperonin GroES
MKFRPLHDRVVVKRVAEEEKTKGGILIPDTAKEKPMEGEIIAVGAGARDEAGKLVPLDVKAGDRVLFGKWSGTEVKLDGQDLLIMKESDIMGIIEGQPAAKPSPRSQVSCPDLIRASIILRRRWIAGSSPAMTSRAGRQPIDPNFKEQNKWLPKT